MEGRFGRPFLGLRREALRQWLRERGYGWREDESNEDRLYRRNWIRHELLPRLRENLNPEVDRRLAALARVAREEEEWLRPLEENLLEGMVERGGGTTGCSTASPGGRSPPVASAGCCAPSSSGRKAI